MYGIEMYEELIVYIYIRRAYEMTRWALECPRAPTLITWALIWRHGVTGDESL